MTAQHSAAPRFRLSPMRPRDPGEEGRAASTLELFFDLVFVIAVSIASSHLHDTVTEGRLGDGVVNYLVVFFGIWWAWMNFTWFATSFDTDDWLYRVLTIVQMGGVLILAAGIGPVFENEDYRLLIGGYVLMRIIMISQWLRASRGARVARWTTIIYAAGIGLAQILWVMWLAIDDSMIRSVGLVVLILAEVAVPVIAEARGKTPWHPHHITERYGCFTIIVLGESLLASANTVFDALGEVEDIVPLISLGVLCLIVTAAMWWIYFWPPHHRAIGSLGGSLRYGYGHYFIFAAAGAFSAGVGVEADSQLGASALNPVLATFTVSVPIVVFVLGVWVVAIRANANAVVNTVVPACALLVLLDPIIPVPTFLTTFFMVIIVITLVVFPPLDDNGRTGAEAVVR
ncbi:putative low temperature requirement protein A [Brevibacterium sediminis]|uniref:Low temperature requirement protein A n=1 Tax=Brevibacterium sediminis TaxID=1857024 RepID=A0ABQ1LY18_9MICO|nr:low temperature requirement protein A [Brevibacterium sediminis]GGC29986.1 putative low temperature requirement protein A [Brevibacterium sediminis]